MPSSWLQHDLLVEVLLARPVRWISSATPQACHGFADINQAHAQLSVLEQSSIFKLRYIVVEDQDAQPPSPL